MQGWLESVVGPDYAAALMWTIAALIVLLVLLVVIRIARTFSVGTFVAGGRNRKTRLAVMDATAVDSHRRLVLVRRDDVEHLILIGGPTDLVVEQNIRLMAPTRRVAEDEAHARHGYEAEEPRQQPKPVHAQPAPQLAPQVAPQPAPRPASAPIQPAAPRPAAPPRPVAAPIAAPPPVQAAPLPRVEPRLQPTLPPAPAPAPVRPAYAPPPAMAASGVQPMRPVETPAHVTAPPPPPVRPAPARKPDIEETLLHELEVSLESEPLAPAAKSAADATLDEEMTKLLSDLAGKR